MMMPFDTHRVPSVSCRTPGGLHAWRGAVIALVASFQQIQNLPPILYFFMSNFRLFEKQGALGTFGNVLPAVCLATCMSHSVLQINSIYRMKKLKNHSAGDED